MNPAEAYILEQTGPVLDILLYLKTVIEAAVPYVDMRYKWGIPCFYVDKAPICYLNAPKKKAYVDLAFWNSAHLTRNLEHLVAENRKVVRSLRYSSLEEVNEEVLLYVLQEAYDKREMGFIKKG